MKLENCSVLPPTPEGAQLMGALMTSYKPVSPYFLERYVIPHLLEIDNDADDGSSRSLAYDAALYDALGRVQNRFTSFSSAPKDHAPRRDPLQSVLHNYYVGKDGHRSQHAKLWLWHWKTVNGEMLQITVSSTNLTSDALNTQIQAGWTDTIVLMKDKEASDPPKPWDTLARFLKALGESANEHTSSEHFAKLLCRCPQRSDISFLASIPGTVLTPLDGGCLRVCAPSIGQWSKADLEGWLEYHNIGSVSLRWPEKGHYWLTQLDDNAGFWCMPQETLETFRGLIERGRMNIKGIPQHEHPFLPDDVLESGESDHDRRWSHAKCYKLEKVGSIIGSHNWSLSAWGDAKTSPRQFELSVILLDKNTHLLRDRGLTDLKPEDIRTCNDFVPPREEPSIIWAQATWEGAHLTVSWRLSDEGEVKGTWCDAHDTHALPRSQSDTVTVDASVMPCTVDLWCKETPHDRTTIGVFDLRTIDAHVADVAKGDHSGVLQQKLDGLLFKRFGAALPGKGGGRTRQQRGGSSGPAPANYQTRWLRACRRYCRVVDNWRENKGMCREDGKRLIDALGRCINDEGTDGALGARIAKGEIEHLMGASVS